MTYASSTGDRVSVSGSALIDKWKEATEQSAHPLSQGTSAWKDYELRRGEPREDRSGRGGAALQGTSPRR